METENISNSSNFHKGRFYALLTIALITIVLWNVPFGNYVLYPFSILGTWFHEMGHGLTALLVGGSFKKLEIYYTGSGVAFFSLPAGKQTLGALVAAGGLLGPPIIGSVFLLSSKRETAARLCLLLFEAAIILSVVIWVRTSIGVLMVLLIGGLILLILWKGNSKAWILTVQVLGVQAVMSTYRQLDYLFMGSANINGQEMLSDTGQIASHLFLPYWFWGALIALLSFALLYYSLKVALKTT